MADKPLATELEDHMVLAQRVELLVGNAEDADNLEGKLSTMRDAELEISHPETRINHGLTRVYGHGAPDIGIRATMTVAEDLFAYLRARGLKKDSNVIPTYTWAIKCTPQNGAAKTIKFTGKLTEKRYIKRDAEQQDPADVEIFIRVLEDAEPVS